MFTLLYFPWDPYKLCWIKNCFLLEIFYFSTCLTSNKLYWIEDQVADVSTWFNMLVLVSWTVADLTVILWIRSVMTETFSNIVDLLMNYFVLFCRWQTVVCEITPGKNEFEWSKWKVLGSSLLHSICASAILQIIPSCGTVLCVDFQLYSNPVF